MKRSANDSDVGTTDPSAFVIDLPSSPHAPASARDAMKELAREQPLAARHLGKVMLLISELVTNAVIHPDAPEPASVRVRVDVTKERIRVEVSDQGRGFERPSARSAPVEEGGYGLWLLAAGASRWSTGTLGERFTVWFEIDQSDTADAA